MKGLEFKDELAAKGMTIEDWAEGREGTPVAKKTAEPTPTAEAEHEETTLSEAEEVAREVAEEKSNSPFGSLRNLGKRIERWMNEGIE